MNCCFVFFKIGTKLEGRECNFNVLVCRKPRSAPLYVNSHINVTSRIKTGIPNSRNAGSFAGM